MTDLKWTGERLTTYIAQEYGTIEHLHRYALAMNLSKQKTILDIASGEGYGSNLLSNTAEYVYGVDIDLAAVEHARNKYGLSRTNLEFLRGSASDIPLPDSSVDVVVSFETIEHHTEHEKMMKEIRRVLRPSGVLLISSPEKKIYSERDPGNSFHVKELYLNEFKRLLSSYFSNNVYYSQQFVLGSLISSEEQLKSVLSFFNGGFSEIKEGLSESDFFNKIWFNLAICSNDKIEDNLLGNSLFDGVKVLEKKISDLSQELETYKNSTSYKFGRRVVDLLYFFRRR